MTAIDIFEGTRLASWGIGLLLIWIVMRRVTNRMVRSWALGHGLQAPSPWPPLKAMHPNIVLASAAMAGLVPLFAFTVHIYADFVTWLDGANRPLPALLALHAFLGIEVYFLEKVAAHPSYKLKWALAWYAFSMGIAWLW